jgi:hypothetical protein
VVVCGANSELVVLLPVIAYASVVSAQRLVWIWILILDIDMVQHLANFISDAALVKHIYYFQSVGLVEPRAAFDFRAK